MEIIVLLLLIAGILVLYYLPKISKGLHETSKQNEVIIKQNEAIIKLLKKSP